MNIFPDSSAAFRRGSTLEDGTNAPSGAPLLTLPRSTVALPSVVQTSSAAAAAATAASPASPSPGFSPFRLLPTTPYYGLLSSCELHVTVAVDESCKLSGCNAPCLMHRLGHLQRLLGDVAERHGAVYHLGTDGGSRDAAGPPQQQQQQQQPSPSSSCSLTYGAYVDAMQDGLRQMSALRASCGPTVRSSHAFYMRVLGHPVWRDLSAMLCVEDGRLLLCVLSSSRVTQRRLTSACMRAGVALEWVGGAVLVMEPSSMSAVEVNPVWVVWEAVLHLPLRTPAADGTAAASAEERQDDAGGGAAAASASTAVRAALDTARSGATVLRGFEVTLVSSLPFRGARRCCPVGRFTEEAAVLSEDVPTVASVRRLVARRYVWRLLPSFHWVLPHFVSALLRCLVERCGLRAFTLRCGPAVGGGAAHTTGEGRRGVAAKSNTASGVQLVSSDAPTSLTVRRGASTVSWVAFSRLSSAAWIDDETRETLVLGGTGGLMDDHGGGEDGDDDVEVEFDLTSIHYERAVPFAASAKRERCVPLLSAGGGEATAAAAAEQDEGLCDDMRSWGSCFRLGVAMRRVIVVDDAEE